MASTRVPGRSDQNSTSSRRRRIIPSMSPPSSDLFRVQPIPDSGRGVVATKTISNGTLILLSCPPSAHVVFWQYRKEVCAQCFYYDRGRHLPVRHHSIGKVFCDVECQTEWLEEQGELGLEAWEDMYGFIQSRRSSRRGGSTDDDSFVFVIDKPGKEATKGSWQAANDIAEILRNGRTSVSSSTPGMQNEKSYRKVLNHTRTQAVDPDILAYLLSGILVHFLNPDKWQDILSLAMDEEPFKSIADLKAHCNTFVQLTTVLPLKLLPSLTTDVCQTLLGAASHNAFGIRSGGGDEREEYMGYALYPWASFFNHSCDPNTGKKQNGRLWELHSLRDLRAGEQCCITYLGGDERDLNVCERRTRLKETWRFECMCERCVREADDVLGSSLQVVHSETHLASH